MDRIHLLPQDSQCIGMQQTSSATHWKRITRSDPFKNSDGVILFEKSRYATLVPADEAATSAAESITARSHSKRLLHKVPLQVSPKCRKESMCLPVKTEQPWASSTARASLLVMPMQLMILIHACSPMRSGIHYCKGRHGDANGTGST